MSLKGQVDDLKLEIALLGKCLSKLDPLEKHQLQQPYRASASQGLNVRSLTFAFLPRRAVTKINTWMDTKLQP
jgi:hypothetical protein